MLTGAAAGPTVSGLKLIRVITLVKGTVWQIQEVFQPDSAIRYLQLGERKLNEEQTQREYTGATVVFVLWLTFLGSASRCSSACSRQHIHLSTSYSTL